LPRRDGKKVARELIDEGYDDLRDVPEGRLENPLHQKIWRACKTGKAELDKAAAEILRALPYPRYYLDFESINAAIPVWPDTRPYQQIVFQWSCHVESRDGSIRHDECLADGKTDPRREVAETMIKTLRKRGPVMVYNQAFEKGRIRDMAERFPDLRDSLLAINDRIFDLLPIARNCYYHPEMMGSFSIKDVLPTIAPELDYHDMEVGDGGMAMEAFAEMLQPDISRERRAQLRDALLAYCKLDTLAMVKITRYFEKGYKNAKE